MQLILFIFPSTNNVFFYTYNLVNCITLFKQYIARYDPELFISKIKGDTFVYSLNIIVEIVSYLNCLFVPADVIHSFLFFSLGFHGCCSLPDSFFNVSRHLFPSSLCREWSYSWWKYKLVKYYLQLFNSLKIVSV